ncbi:LysR family transcriptional regulator [Cedecea sp. NFIX57]|uniref:LysR family transcriptional regulator n=1 Tax=Cedecea sp. NFIX57 TaxID=1566286 RepID=UPI000A0BF6AE|nr:LysR family transcriptional regulator [Cedecea sp. NFIX57]SMG28220.1 DNA-binding transcriptional regulator, LysR family [Cedecea sp. NFIX57]
MPTHQEQPPLSVALSRLRLRHFQALDALQQLGSLRRVAAELGLSQSATVALINDLEHAFGITLVKREKQGSTLTSEAEMLIARSKIILQEVALVQQHTLQSRDIGGRVRIGASPYLISFLLPQMLNLFRTQHGNVYVDIQEDTLDALLQKLVEGELDAVIGNVDTTATLSPGVELAQIFLWDESLSIIAGRGHALYDHAHATLEQILEGPWILPHADSHIRHLVDKAISMLNAPPLVPMIECRGILNLINLTAATAGLSIAPTSQINQFLWHDRVKLIPCPVNIAIPPYAFITRKYKKPLSLLDDMQRCATEAVALLANGEPR